MPSERLGEFAFKQLKTVLADNGLRITEDPVDTWVGDDMLHYIAGYMSSGIKHFLQEKETSAEKRIKMLRAELRDAGDRRDLDRCLQLEKELTTLTGE